MIKEYFSYILKGIAMGIANVIPGVSGGTIALITNIFEKLINAIKSFNIKAIRLLLKGKFREFASHTDLFFLISVFGGVIIAIVTIARLFDFLFTHYPIYIWAYFFGLILASVFFVGKTITRWSVSVIIIFIIGTALAILLTSLNPATENTGFVYLMLCGVAAICSMILPGLSGSFILILMGNYQLVAIDAINNLRLDILLPVMIGAVVGLLAFSHLLSWVFRKFRNETIGILTGFILGSLGVLWPWKDKVYLLDDAGNLVLKKGEAIVTSYSYQFPQALNTEVILAFVFIILGVVSIWILELTAKSKQADNK